ncbi:MAG TPA: YgjV family protein [Terriglobia bacterium]|nr:YgjV family protein [Terriglobia bacterium]
MRLIPDLVGWAATAIFASSYFFKGPRRLRVVQAAAALVWIAYGILIGSLPVIASNVIVSGLAVCSARRASAA